jgi:non-lysosomal glucosylceramidase
VLPAEPTRKALEALWKYNFTPDVGVYRRNFEAIKGGRWYAMPGEGGLLMCTWPHGGGEKAAGKGEATFVSYFNECMTGFEYQVAGHMIWEGLVEKGLAVTRMIHDRYHGSKRNPWNEVECSSHYARAMASHGVYLAACGFEYHGPRGHLGFAPRLFPENFRAAFTAAEGWGTLMQKVEGRRFETAVTVRWGKLRLRTVAVEVAAEQAGAPVTVRLRGKSVRATPSWDDRRLTVTLAEPAVLAAGDALEIRTGQP